MVDKTEPMEEFEARVRRGGSGPRAEADAVALRSGDHEAPFRIAAQCVSVAIAEPEQLVEVYDGLALGWLGRAPDGPPVGGGLGRPTTRPLGRPTTRHVGRPTTTPVRLHPPSCGTHSGSWSSTPTPDGTRPTSRLGPRR